MQDSRHVGGACRGVVRRRAGRQFVGRPAGPAAVGDLCRVDAARLAARAPRGATPTRFGAGGGWSPSMARTSASPIRRRSPPRSTKARTRRGRAAFAKLDHDRLTGSRPAQSAGRGRDRPRRRIGMGAGAAAAGAAAQPRAVARRSVVWRGGLCGRRRRRRAPGSTVTSCCAPRDRRKPRGDHAACRMAPAWCSSGCAPGTAPTRILEWLEVREIRVRVGRPDTAPTSCGCGPVSPIPTTAPALELAQLYARALGARAVFPRAQTPGAADRSACRVTRSRPPRRRSPPSSWPVPCSPPNGCASPGATCPVLRVSCRENPGALRETDVAVISTSATACSPRPNSPAS